MNSIPPPRVSVLMPVYNGGIYLKEAIDTILNQSFSNFELVIVNDGSTDNSEEIILRYSDPRIRLENNQNNLGLINSLNIGLGLCEGDYIVRMDQDDISFPDRILLQVKFMDENPEVGLLGSWFEDFGDKIESKIVRYSIDDSDIRIRHLYQTHISHPTAILRKSVIDESKVRFDPEYKHGEDYNFWVSISAFCKISNYPDVLVRKRDHPRNISNSFSSVMYKTCTKVKQRQFAAMGAPINQEEADLYTRFADPEWHFTLKEMSQLHELLERINQANSNTGYISQNIYSSYLASKWFHLCFHNKNLKITGYSWFKKVSFNHYYKPSFFSEFRFKLKSLGLPF